ncbi:MAG: phosphoribosylformylglycinamidine synthase subunit PurS [Acidimicrobiia bacterium]|nr:phosphoribosylformylglycinamidine synthase subunit PurS [Acidimicrobiia bacterium]
MTAFRYRVTINRKRGLSDPEGATTRKALQDLGFISVESVSFGRILDLEVDSSDAETAQAEVEAMCAKLLANPVMEDFTIEAVS